MSRVPDYGHGHGHGHGHADAVSDDRTVSRRRLGSLSPSLHALVLLSLTLLGCQLIGDAVGFLNLTGKQSVMMVMIQMKIQRRAGWYPLSLYYDPHSFLLKAYLFGNCCGPIML